MRFLSSSMIFASSSLPDVRLQVADAGQWTQGGGQERERGGGGGGGGAAQADVQDTGQVAGRCAREGRQSQAPRGALRDRDHPVLERVRRVTAVVLDPQRARHTERLGQVVGAHQPGEPGVEVRLVTGVRRDGQQAGVAPDRGRARLDPLARDPGEVVRDLERSEAVLAGVRRTEVVAGTALAAGEPGRRSEGGPVDHRGGGQDSHVLRPFSSSSRLRAARTGRSWHLHRVTTRVVRAVAIVGCRGFAGPCPSAPRDEMCGCACLRPRAAAARRREPRGRIPVRWATL